MRDLDLQLKIDAAVNGLREIEQVVEAERQAVELSKQGSRNLANAVAAVGRESRSLSDVAKQLDGIGRSVQSAGRVLTRSLTAPLAALGAIGVRNFTIQQKAIAAVEAGLISTGNAAGKTSQELQDLASELQRASLFGDEEILSGVTSQLLTFGNITGDVFNRAQQASVDLAARLGGDLQSAAIQLGKALNDPTEGLSALSRSGITFSESQKEVVKQLVETNDLASAQALILREIEIQYGGTAAALAEVDPYTQLRNQLGDLTEIIGRVANDFLAPLVRRISDLATRFQALSPATQDTIIQLGGLVAALGPVLIAVGSFVRLISFSLVPFSAGIAALSGAYVAFTAAVSSASGALALFRTALVATGIGAIVVAIGALIVRFIQLRNEVGSFSDAFGVVAINVNIAMLEMQSVILGAVDVIIRAIQRIPDKFREIVETTRNTFTNLGNRLGTGVFNLINGTAHEADVAVSTFSRNTAENMNFASRAIDDNNQRVLELIRLRDRIRSGGAVQASIEVVPPPVEEIPTIPVNVDPVISEASVEEIKGRLEEITVSAERVETLVPRVATQFEQLSEQVGERIQGGLVDGLTNFITETDRSERSFRDFASSFLKQIQQMIVRSLILQGIQRTLGSVGIPGFSDGGAVPTFATGGRVRGAGSGTSDSILARLSNGEHVIRTRAASFFGHEFFDALNSMNSKKALALLQTKSGKVNRINNSGASGFADGGAVAAGGGGMNVVLNIENNSSGEIAGQTSPPVRQGRDFVIGVMLEDTNNRGEFFQQQRALAR